MSIVFQLKNNDFIISQKKKKKKREKERVLSVPKTPLG